MSARITDATAKGRKRRAVMRKPILNFFCLGFPFKICENFGSKICWERRTPFSKNPRFSAQRAGVPGEPMVETVRPETFGLCIRNSLPFGHSFGEQPPSVFNYCRLFHCRPSGQARSRAGPCCRWLALSDFNRNQKSKWMFLCRSSTAWAFSLGEIARKFSVGEINFAGFRDITYRTIRVRS